MRWEFTIRALETPISDANLQQRIRILRQRKLGSSLKFQVRIKDSISEQLANYEDAPLTEVLLKSRDARYDFKSGVNKTQLVGSVSESGFHCQECNQTFKDSTGYLDHINSKRHLQNSGLGLRIEKSTLEQVEARILHFRDLQAKGVQEYNLQEQVEKALKEEAEKKESKKLKNTESKRRKKEVEIERASEFHLDDDVAKMMGMSGFGSSKK